MTVSAPQPETPSPDAALLDMERELIGLLERYEVLHTVWPKLPKAMDGYRVGQEVDRVLTRIGKLEEAIASTRARCPTVMTAAPKSTRKRIATRRHEGSGSRYLNGPGACRDPRTIQRLSPCAPDAPLELPRGNAGDGPWPGDPAPS